MDLPKADSRLTTADVLEILCTCGKPIHQWGVAVDGTPILSAQTGGTRQPAILVTAGVHAHEPAGVHAALHLLQRLDTQHEVHVLPLRDPFGLAGVNHCLSFASGERVGVPSHRAALDYLLTHGQLLARRKEIVLFKLGEFGFLWNQPTPGLQGSRPMATFLQSVMSQDPDVLQPLWGKSTMLLLNMVDVEGVGELQRCYHRVFSTQGESLHLNRFFGRKDAPPEVAAVERLLQQLRPGLTCDLHEGAEPGFWLPVIKPDKHPERPLAMARAFLAEIRARDYPITTYEEWAAIHQVTDKERVGPEPSLPGLLWTHPLRAGEGHNLGSYSSLMGLAFDTEPPIVLPLAERVDGVTNGILAAINVWERTAADANGA